MVHGNQWATNTEISIATTTVQSNIIFGYREEMDIKIYVSLKKNIFKFFSQSKCGFAFTPESFQIAYKKF